MMFRDPESWHALMDALAPRGIPRVMLGATVAMVALSVALTIFAAPLYDLTSRAGANITGPGYYITTVFTGESK